MYDTTHDDVAGSGTHDRGRDLWHHVSDATRAGHCTCRARHTYTSHYDHASSAYGGTDGHRPKRL
jgi:hypothetical protein